MWRVEASCITSGLHLSSWSFSMCRADRLRCEDGGDLMDLLRLHDGAVLVGDAVCLHSDLMLEQQCQWQWCSAGLPAQTPTAEEVYISFMAFLWQQYLWIHLPRHQHQASIIKNWTFLQEPHWLVTRPVWEVIGDISGKNMLSGEKMDCCDLLAMPHTTRKIFFNCLIKMCTGCISFSKQKYRMIAWGRKFY